MAQYVHPGTSSDHLWHGVSVDGIHKAHYGAERVMGNTGFSMQFQEIKDSYASCFAASSGGGGYCNQRVQGSGDRAIFTDRRVNVGQKVSRISGVEISYFSGVNTRAAPNSDIAIEPALNGKLNSLLENILTLV